MAKCRGAGTASCRVEISRCAKPEAAFALTRGQRRRVQAALAAQGVNPGPADGVFGPRTRAAVAAWQRSRGYAATGELTSGQVQWLLGPGAQAARQSESEVEQTAATRQSESDLANQAQLETARRPEPEGGGDLWGSIAFSQDERGGYAWAIVWNGGGHDAAMRKALEVCEGEGGGRCHEAGWFRNSCGALALGDGNGYGTGGGDTTVEAERSALGECRKVNRECRVEVSRCSTQGLETAGVEEPKARAEAERATEEAGLDTRRKEEIETVATCPMRGTYVFPTHDTLYVKNYGEDVGLSQFAGEEWGREMTRTEAVYEGDLCNGVPNGRGVVTWSLQYGKAYAHLIEVSNKYEGEWKDGLRHGHGMWSKVLREEGSPGYPGLSGSKSLFGEWKNGELWDGVYCSSTQDTSIQDTSIQFLATYRNGERYESF